MAKRKEFEVLCRCVMVSSETYYVEAKSEEEAIEKAKEGEYLNYDSETDNVDREDFEVSLVD